jgi:hypothetical protein
MAQHDADVMAEVDSRIEESIENLRAVGGLNAQPDMSGKLQAVEKNLNTTGDEVGILAEEVASLILQSSSHDGEILRLKQENERFRSEFVAVSTKVLKMFIS